MFNETGTKETFSLTGNGDIENVKLSPCTSLKINPNFIQYLYTNEIVYVSGSNLVIYNIETRKQRFLLRKNNHFKITYLSVGTVSSSYSKKKDISKKQFTTKDATYDKEKVYICLGEYSSIQQCFYITVLKPYNPSIQYTIKSNEQIWKINYASILNNSPYCVNISQKTSTSKKTPVLSRLSFAKYTFEQFISQETIPEELIYCCYNPKNTIELIICGKGYLRLWNVFINEGSLKEHQQRFLRGKQEKEHTFLKAQFFDKKPFLLIVGTKENMFYIIDGFQVIHELNVCYSSENIYDLNVQNFNIEEEDDDIGGLKGLLDTLTKKELDTKLKELSMLTSSSAGKGSNGDNSGNNNNDSDGNVIRSEDDSQMKSITQGNNDNSNGVGSGNNNNNAMMNTESNDEHGSGGNDVFKRLYKAKEDDYNDVRVNRSNRVKYFELINDNLLFVVYQNEGILLLYRIEWNRKLSEGESELDNKKWNISENRIIRVAKNIKTVSNYSMYKPKNDIILLVDSIEGKGKYRSLVTSLFKMRRNISTDKANTSLNQISFETKLFNSFFETKSIKFIEMNEKKETIFIITKDNIFQCFDLISNEYIIRQKYKDEILSFTVCPCNNLFAMAFNDKVQVYSKIKNTLHIFTELEVRNAVITWASKGNVLAIAGENRNNQLTRKMTYCVYFVNVYSYNTENVIENLSHRIVKAKFIDNDKYIFLLLENSYVIGFYINTAGNSINLHQMFDERQHDFNSNQFKLVFTSHSKGRVFVDFDYDEEHDLICAVHNTYDKVSVISNMKNNDKATTPIYFDVDCSLTSIKIIKELKVLVGGDKQGNINVYTWPFKGYTNDDVVIKIDDNIKSSINIHETAITHLLSGKNFKNFITVSEDSCVVLSNLFIRKGGEYKYFEYFSKGMYPQLEMLIQPVSMYEMKIENIERKEKNVEILDKAMIRMKQTMEADIEEIRNVHKTELENMENNLKQNTDDEQAKYENIEAEIQTLKENMAIDLSKRLEELEKDKVLLTTKYKEKIELYESEINRLKNELLNIKKAIEEKYANEVNDQKEFYDNLLKEYNDKFAKIKAETDHSLATLVNITSEYDDATDKIVEDYKRLVTNLDNKILQTKEANELLLKQKEEELRIAKRLEDEHKEKLEQKVKESDKLIEKNVEIKQSIINATQRTITFQEQLLETEKNLLKIDKKLENLISKNKHLEQIRFVLEHRMTSLEKEKAPLEGQCSFLENQKNKLTDEFNNIILQINKHNQELENKQSQLRASLIQNYEIHDQKNYVEAKLTQIKSEIEQFLMNYQDSDETQSFSENKATKVALNFKQFYNKYFSNTIEEELSNYQYYAQKLQEQTDKDGIANNFDLVMRNKAEEKLISEKKKVEELKDVKEKGFRRMQNENTILIAECNRLRKNLHEIYMHVVDIEQRFEHLTKINPKLTKQEIVSQIKEFIRVTHEQIKENYSRTRKVQQKVINQSSINLNESNTQGQMFNEERKNDGGMQLPEIQNKSYSFLKQGSVSEHNLQQGSGNGSYGGVALPKIN